MLKKTPPFDGNFTCDCKSCVKARKVSAKTRVRNFLKDKGGCFLHPRAVKDDCAGCKTQVDLSSKLLTLKEAYRHEDGTSG
jgi:hypothetical protein